MSGSKRADHAAASRRLPSKVVAHEGHLAKDFRAPRPTADERLAAGKALRAKFPFESLAAYVPNPKRKDPVAMLEAQNRTRIQELVPLRFARMLTSPFAFMRGSAAIMAADLATSRNTGITVQACGDAHLANFGAYASAERELVFAINDFDETLPGHWEWDLKRLAASAAVAARFLGGNKADAEAGARAVVAGYRRRVREYARMGYLDVWYTKIGKKEILAGLPRRDRVQVEQGFAKARRHTALQTLTKMAELADGQYRLIEQPLLLVRETHTDSGQPILEALESWLQSYIGSLQGDRHRLLARYRMVDVARKVVGVGSVGTRCWIVLFQGADASDPLILQVKQAQLSVLQPYLGRKMPYASEGQRVVVGQRMIQGSSDIFLGYGRVGDVDFYVRQLRDMKGGIELKPGETTQASLRDYCGLCAWALAHAHAKSGDAARIAGYVGKSERFDEAMGRFALAYASQTERDYEALAAAAKKGRIPVAKSL